MQIIFIILSIVLIGVNSQAPEENNTPPPLDVAFRIGVCRHISPIQVSSIVSTMGAWNIERIQAAADAFSADPLEPEDPEVTMAKLDCWFCLSGTDCSPFFFFGRKCKTNEISRGLVDSCLIPAPTLPAAPAALAPATP